MPDAEYPHRHRPTHHAPVERFNEPMIVQVNVCTKDRQPLLACEAGHRLCQEVWQAADFWRVGRYVIMPDHIHLFCAPGRVPTTSLRQWVEFWKSRIAAKWPIDLHRQVSDGTEPVPPGNIPIRMPSAGTEPVPPGNERAGIGGTASVCQKDGKQHRYWSVTEHVTGSSGRRFERHVLYLGEISDAQRVSWERRIRVFDEERGETRQMWLFPSDRPVCAEESDSVQVVLSGFALRRPRQWGACWLFCRLWEELRLDGFWGPLLPASRKGTQWLDVLKVLCANRLIAPSSEWRVHREWFARSAMRDLLGCGAEVAAKDTLYRGLDRLMPHKEALFVHLRARWADLFNTTFDVLLYDLTSTYFESDPPYPEDDKRRHGYSRDHRSDCVQVVVAPVVTPEGFPVAYEVMPGNTADNATLPAFLDKIEQQYGKARRIWLMDRGIPTEDTLAELRPRGGRYVVGTPKGRLTRLEAALAERPWQQVRDNVRVKLLPDATETLVFVESGERVCKERAMRQRRMRMLLKRLAALASKPLPYEKLLQKIGAARREGVGVVR